MTCPSDLFFPDLLRQGGNETTKGGMRANFCRLSLADSREMLNFAASTVFIHLNYNAYEKEIKQKKCENGENVW